MNKAISIILGGALLFLGVPAWAAPTATLAVSATVPVASAVTVTVSSVDATSNAFTPEPSGFTALSMDPMTFNTTTQTYTANHYWAVDYGVSGGSGTPGVTFTYTEGTNPNGTTNGMGNHASLTMMKETTSGETAISGGKTTLAALSNTHYPSTDFTGGWARSYIGICSGNPTTDPAGCVAFTNADAAGQYTGSLAVTVVVNG